MTESLFRNHCQPQSVFICRCVHSCGFKRWCRFPPLATVWDSLHMKAQKRRVQADVAQNSHKTDFFNNTKRLHDCHSVLTKVAAILDRPTFRSLFPNSDCCFWRRRRPWTWKIRLLRRYRTHNKYGKAVVSSSVRTPNPNPPVEWKEEAVGTFELCGFIVFSHCLIHVDLWHGRKLLHPQQA